jgi:S1-C subfamily serine protease
MFVGCLIGIGVAAVTGGAGAPLAMLGCGGGYTAGALAGESCSPAAECIVQVTSYPQLARNRGWNDVPMCGGWLGLTVANSTRSDTGLQILTVQPGTAASAMGLRSGDILVRVQERPTRTREDIRVALNSSAGATTIHATVVRGGLPVTVGSSPSAPRAAPRLLGVEFREPSRVTYRDGVRVMSLDPESPLNGKLVVNDLVVAVGRRGVWDDASMQDALRLAEEGVPISILIERNGVRFETQVSPASRQGRNGL